MVQQPQKQPPLARMAQQQKSAVLHPLVSATEGQIRAAFAEARAEVAPLLDQFAAAYGVELARVNADRDEEEEPKQRPVPNHWLTNSGWAARIRGAVQSAAHKAGQRSLAHIIQAHDDALTMGQEDAQGLMREAMRPAVLAIVHRGLHRRVVRRQRAKAKRGQR
jgi:hypothetical protein